MIGYAVLGSNNLARAASSSGAVSAELGMSRMMDFGERGHARGAADVFSHG